MRWKKYTIHTTTEVEDLVSLMLNELGVEGVQIEDNIPLSEDDTKGMFIDILPELPPDDGTSRISFFLRQAEPEAQGIEKSLEGSDRAKNKKTDGAAEQAESAKKLTKAEQSADQASAVDDSYRMHDRIWTEPEIRELLQAVREGLSELAQYTEIGEGRIETGETQDTDWMNNWKQYFKPFLLEGLLIKPTWEEIPEAYREAAARKEIEVIEMDPGMAFGTGSHETTKLCMRMLRRCIKGGEQVLDIGTGSGILGIAALKLGADHVTATDLDEVCREAVSENLRANGISEEQFRLLIGNVIGDSQLGDAVGYGAYDIVVANILAPVIVLLAAPDLADRFLKKGGVFITSGIIDTKEAEVLKAFQENPAFEVLTVAHEGEWVSITAVRK